MKCVLFAVAMLASGLAMAQVECSLTFSSETFLEGKRQFASSNTWDNLLADDMKLLQDKGVKLINKAGEEDNKGGEWSITLKSKTTCSDGTVTNLPDLNYVGITAKGEARIARTAVKTLDELVKAAEDQTGKGNKHAWGTKAKEKGKDDKK